VVPALFVKIIKEHSIVLAAMDSLVIHTTRAAVWQLNVNQIVIALYQPNASRASLARNVVMYANKLCVDQIQIVHPKIILPHVTVVPDTEVMLPMLTLVADHYQHPALYHLNVQPIHIVMVAIASRLAPHQKNAP
jgi:hypothetical protein